MIKLNVSGFDFAAKAFTCGCDIRRLSRVRDVIMCTNRCFVIISNAVDLWVNMAVIGITGIVVGDTADGSGLFGTSVKWSDPKLTTTNLLRIRQPKRGYTLRTDA